LVLLELKLRAHLPEKCSVIEMHYYKNNYINKNIIEFFKYILNFCGGTLGTAATTGLLYQPRVIGDGDCGEIGGMKIGRGNRSTRRKPAPAPLCPPQISHD
jgi:hypothetical protein